MVITNFGWGYHPPPKRNPPWKKNNPYPQFFQKLLFKNTIENWGVDYPLPSLRAHRDVSASLDNRRAALLNNYNT